MKRFWLILRDDNESDGGCLLAVIACLLIAAAAFTYWSSFNFAYFSPGAILFFVVLVSCCVLGSRSAYRDDNAADFFEVAKKGAVFYSGGSALYAVAALVELAIKESGTMFDALVIVIGTPLVMAGACLPLLIMQSVVIYAMKK